MAGCCNHIACCVGEHPLCWLIRATSRRCQRERCRISLMLLAASRFGPCTWPVHRIYHSRVVPFVLGLIYYVVYFLDEILTPAGMLLPLTVSELFSTTPLIGSLTGLS